MGRMELGGERGPRRTKSKPVPLAVLSPEKRGREKEGKEANASSPPRNSTQKNKPVQVILEKGRGLARGEDTYAVQRAVGPSLFCRRREENTRAHTHVLSPSLFYKWQTFPKQAVHPTAKTTGQEFLLKGETARKKKRSPFLGFCHDLDRRNAHDVVLLLSWPAPWFPLQ
ncbi:uncharacterized protein LOC106507881 isoform X3 [Sus scrofa]|uniref:uncharacterized protein LOC106507881 isoform X3 n=1 Tax=Sus scrofa TaxID=9823 RepID=UPI0006B1B76E|nr:uncharacterized protein LOC106507881 isoform X3 [Sus scrofa]